MTPNFNHKRNRVDDPLITEIGKKKKRSGFRFRHGRAAALYVRKLDRTLFEHEAPRRLPQDILFTLFRLHLRERSFRAYLDIPLLGGITVTLALIVFRVMRVLWIISTALVCIRLAFVVWHMSKRAREDITLLKYGKVVQAQVLGVRPCSDSEHNTNGFYLDCIIPVEQRRFSLGSAWMRDETLANRLKDMRFVPVICLPHTPGNWYLLDPGPSTSSPHPQSTHQSESQPGQDHQ